MATTSKRAARALALSEKPENFLSTVQIGVTLSGFLSASFGASSIAPYLIPAVESWGVHPGIAGGLVNIILTLIISYCSIVISEMVPKRIAMQRTEQIARAVVPAIDVFATICRPIIWLIGKNTNGIVRVLGFDPFAKNLPDFVQAADLETIWRESDAISLHCPLTDDNRDLLDADTLARCKKGVIVVNTARGGLIDEAALLAAVHSGQVRMAGLDSFAVEPMAAGHPFQHQSGFILSPHIGGVTSDAYVNMGLGAARNALAVLNRTATA